MRRKEKEGETEGEIVYSHFYYYRLIQRTVNGFSPRICPCFWAHFYDF